MLGPNGRPPTPFPPGGLVPDAFGANAFAFGANAFGAAAFGAAAFGAAALGADFFAATHGSHQAFFSLSNIVLPSKMGFPQPARFGPNSFAQHGCAQYSLPFSTLNATPLSCFPHVT